MMKNDLEMDLFIMVRHIFMIYSHVKIKNFVWFSMAKLVRE